MNKQLQPLLLDKFKKAAEKRLGLRQDAFDLRVWEGIYQTLIGVYGYEEVLNWDEQATEKIVAKDAVALFTVSESWFFREEYQLQEAALFLLSCAKEKKGLLKVLSIGCALGEEIYSLAMLLHENRRSLEGIDFLGIDINPANIKSAASGIYPLASIRGLSETRKKRFFEETEKSLHARDLFFPFVHFEVANVMDAEWALKGPYDVVFCRNVLLYLTSFSRKRLLAKIRQCLKKRGRLYVASAEAPFLSAEHWVRFEKEKKLCEKKENRLETALKKREKQALAPEDKKFMAGSASSLDSESSKLFFAKELADEGEYRQASKVLRDLLKQNSSLSEAYYLLGVIELEQERKEKARAYFSKAIVHDRHHQNALRYLSLLSEENALDKGAAAVNKFMEERK